MKKIAKTVRREFIEILIISMVGVLFNVVLYPINPYNITASILVWLSLSKGNGYIVDLIDLKISWVERPILRVTVGMVAMMTYTVLAFATVMVSLNWFFADKDPWATLSRIELGDFTVAILITLVITMFFHGRAFYLNWKEALLREEKLKSESLKSRYESLKNQVNPHFLFNSLNVLSSLVYDDQKKAVAFIRKMSDVYRYVLEKKDEELVPLSDEMEFVNSYVYLQKIRFGENFELDINHSGAKGYVPPLAIQLLIENTIKHNIVSEAKPLKVSLEIAEKEIVISNNIQEKRTKDSTGIGLSNLIARYNHLSDKDVEIVNDQQTFTVKLPILQLKK